jgi:hypothetical protein
MSLDLLKERRKIWLDCLTGSDQHSIVQQLFRMIWNFGAFHIVNECRRIAQPIGNGNVKLNALVNELIDECFFESQFSAIRRLVDEYPIADHPQKRDVYSLVSLINDMEEHSQLLTRINLFKAEGREYDCEKIKSEFEKYLLNNSNNLNRAVWVPPELSWHFIETRHSQIDLLTDVKHERSPEDMVKKELFTSLKSKIAEACNGVKNYANKFIAHAATPGSRAINGSDEMNVTLGGLRETQKTIFKITHFLNVYLLGTGDGLGLPTPQYNLFEYLDFPFVVPEKVNILETAWHSYDEEIKTWREEGENLLKG